MHRLHSRRGTRHCLHRPPRPSHFSQAEEITCKYAWVLCLLTTVGALRAYALGQLPRFPGG